MLNKYFLFSLSLSSFSSFFFLPQFFFSLARRPAPSSPSSLSSPTNSLITDLFHRPTPSPIAKSTRFPSTQMGYRCFLSWQAVKASWFWWVRTRTNGTSGPIWGIGVGLRSEEGRVGRVDSDESRIGRVRRGGDWVVVFSFLLWTGGGGGGGGWLRCAGVSFFFRWMFLLLF